VSPRLPGSRNAIAGIGLAAAGVVLRRLGGRKPASAAPPPASVAEPESVDGADVARARSELAEELARRAARQDA
jgi:hypothetical protein